jgi:hypothetical protein
MNAKKEKLTYINSEIKVHGRKLPEKLELKDLTLKFSTTGAKDLGSIDRETMWEIEYEGGKKIKTIEIELEAEIVFPKEEIKNISKWDKNSNKFESVENDETRLEEKNKLFNENKEKCIEIFDKAFSIEGDNEGKGKATIKVRGEWEENWHWKDILRINEIREVNGTTLKQVITLDEPINIESDIHTWGKVGVGAVVILITGAIGWFGYKVWKEKDEEEDEEKEL